MTLLIIWLGFFDKPTSDKWKTLYKGIHTQILLGIKYVFKDKIHKYESSFAQSS